MYLHQSHARHERLTITDWWQSDGGRWTVDGAVRVSMRMYTAARLCENATYVCMRKTYDAPGFRPVTVCAHAAPALALGGSVTSVRHCVAFAFRAPSVPHVSSMKNLMGSLNVAAYARRHPSIHPSIHPPIDNDKNSSETRHSPPPSNQ